MYNLFSPENGFKNTVKKVENKRISINHTDVLDEKTVSQIAHCMEFRFIVERVIMLYCILNNFQHIYETVTDSIFVNVRKPDIHLCKTSVMYDESDFGKPNDLTKGLNRQSLRKTKSFSFKAKTIRQPIGNKTI